MPTQTEQGKAFEFAMVKTLRDFILTTNQDVEIEETASLIIAKRYFDSLSLINKEKMSAGANAAVRLLIRLEPQLENPSGNCPLVLAMQEDTQGQSGDVRDILTLRRQNNWIIGISCKHNHSAVKHSRLSKTLDFGENWVGAPCSLDYFRIIAPIFEELYSLKKQNKRWSDIANKADKFYIPILNAFISELKKLVKENQEVPARLLEYLLGRYDFYKVITKDSRRQTIIQAFNFHNSLNQNAGVIKPANKINKLLFPTKIFSIEFINNSTNTICVFFDRGWAIKFRIHNASAMVEPSLKFDINIEGMPPELYTNYQSWE